MDPSSEADHAELIRAVIDVHGLAQISRQSRFLVRLNGSATAHGDHQLAIVRRPNADIVGAHPPETCPGRSSAAPPVQREDPILARHPRPFSQIFRYGHGSPSVARLAQIGAPEECRFHTPLKRHRSESRAQPRRQRSEAD
jgi:hypothetical protein